MAHEPQIELEAYAFDIKRFDNNGGIAVKICNTPAYLDKQTNQWVDLDTMYFDVNMPAGNQRMNALADEIESYLRAGDSVRVLVAGNLTETKGSQGGTFKRIYPRRFYILGHKPKNQQQQRADFIGNQTAAGNTSQPVSQPTGQQPASDPWSQPQDGFGSFGGYEGEPSF